MSKKRDINRRDFLKLAGGGVVAMSASSVSSCSPASAQQSGGVTESSASGEMTYRINPTSGDKVSLLGYGMMRLPMITVNGESVIDQEMANELVDYAIEHGVNYFDTAPLYMKGLSEVATGVALSRHPREKFFVATKLSNMQKMRWDREEAIKMYKASFKRLQVDYIDYLLLHSIGGSTNEDDSMTVLKGRFFDNGILDYLVEERKAGRIRNLGFSYHGDIKVFDYLLSMHDTYKWDFVQIQVNYIDWRYAKQIRELNTNGEYLLGELEKLNIPAVIMEPLLGGRLAKLPASLANRLIQREPNNSIASWAFRYAGTPSSILTVLSGMTYMEHLQENVETYSPLKPLSEDETEMLYGVARDMMEYSLIPCTACQYCMPCPYGIDIPEILRHYNDCVIEDNRPEDTQDEKYQKSRRAFLIGYDRSVPKLRQASHCIGCNMCVPHCPQKIDIPRELTKIDRYIESLKQGEYSIATMTQILNETGCSCVIAKGSMIREYHQRGIADLYDIIHGDEAEFIRGAKIADKVVGKGAAALMIIGGIKEVYTNMICETAIELLEKHNVKVGYKEVVPYILNRTKDGWCPVEERCRDTDDLKVMLSRIEKFIESIKK